jgi:hypothetical protein
VERAFAQAADGTRTHDLLHGNQFVDPSFPALMRVSRPDGCRRITVDYRGFGQSLDSQTDRPCRRASACPHARSTERSDRVRRIGRGARRSSAAGVHGAPKEMLASRRMQQCAGQRPRTTRECRVAWKGQRAARGCSSADAAARRDPMGLAHVVLVQGIRSRLQPLATPGSAATVGVGAPAGV